MGYTRVLKLFLGIKLIERIRTLVERCSNDVAGAKNVTHATWTVEGSFSVNEEGKEMK